MIFNEFGEELPDPTPVAIPLRFRNQQISHRDMMRQIVREEMSRAASMAGAETFEEADDFDVGDDYDPSSPYEMHFDQEDYTPAPPAQQPVSSPPGEGAPATEPGGSQGAPPAGGAQPE